MTFTSNELFNIGFLSGVNNTRIYSCASLQAHALSDKYSYDWFCHELHGNILKVYVNTK